MTGSNSDEGSPRQFRLRCRLTLLVSAAACLPLLGVSDPAVAQVQQGGQQTETVVVTAEKRAENIQDVPVPVTVLNPDVLTDNSKTLLRDYFSSVPGLNLMPSFENSQFPSIRGITTGAFSNPTVGITVDDVPFGASTVSIGSQNVPDIDPGDLDHIEVLRGPQGTLYGANSMGGLIKYVTKDPSPDAFAGRLEAGLSGVYNGAEPGYNVRGSFNIPLDENLAVRVSAYDRLDPGYVDNVFTGKSGVNVNKVGGARVSFLWKPITDLSIKLAAVYQRASGNGTSEVYVPTAGFPVTTGLQGLQQNTIPNTGQYYTEIQDYSAIINYSLGWATLTSVTGYNIDRHNDTLDYSGVLGATVAKFVPASAGGVALPYHEVSNTFTQETRVDVPIGTRLDLLAGGFFTFEDEPEGFQSDVPENPATGQTFADFYHTVFPRTFQEYAAFGTVTVHVTDQFDIELGGRESHTLEHDKPNVKTGQYVISVLGAPSSPLIVPALRAVNSEFTYLVSPQYKITPDVMIYARLSSGYRPGGANPNAAAVATLPAQYSADTTKNYEVGLKGDFWDHLISIDMSAYYIDWSDIQIGLRDPATGLGYTANGGGAKSEGVEFDLKARPLEGLSLDAWVDYDDASLTASFPATATVYGAPGNRLPDSSKYSAHFSADQSFPLTESLQGFVGGEISYVGDRVGPFQAKVTSPRQIFPAYTQLDLHAGVTMDTWKLNLYANNVTDTRGVLDGGIGYLVPYAFYYTTPRTVGFQVVKTF